MSADAQAGSRPAGPPGAPVLRPADARALNTVLARVREHGGRSTVAKRLIITALLEAPGHRSAEELAAFVQAQAPDVHLSTVYRNLDELERLLVIDRTVPGHGPATYHLGTTAHGHLLCAECRTMTEIPGDLFAGLADEAQQRYGFQIEPRRFAVLGTCAACARAR